MMAYRQSIKQKKISPSYFEQQEARRLNRKYPKGIPLSETSRLGFRELSGSVKHVHEKGSVIEYKGGLAKVNRVEKKGIWVTPYNSSSMTASKRKVFISEKKLEKGKAYPVYVNFIP